MITKKAIKNIPPVGEDSMLTALNVSIDIDWITKVETSQSQSVVLSIFGMISRSMKENLLLISLNKVVVGCLDRNKLVR